MAVGMAATMGRDDAAAGEECAGSDELPDETWREITVAEGSRGPRSYMFLGALKQLIESPPPFKAVRLEFDGGQVGEPDAEGRHE